jgi:signal peptidase I
MSADCPKVFRVRGLSMAPVLWPGDFLELDSFCALRKGDIVVVRRDGLPIAHRIYALGEKGVQTWGDSSPKPDPWVPLARVEGVVIEHRRFGIRMPVIPLPLVSLFNSCSRPIFWRIYYVKARLKMGLASGFKALIRVLH